MGFNENLKGELEYIGMPVKELAYKTGIPKQTLDKYLLSNASMPPADKAVAIAQVLEVSVEYLVTGKNNQNYIKSDYILSPEVRLMADYIEPLTREKRRLVEDVIIELVSYIKEPVKDEPMTLTLLQKVFLRLFR